jgi:hypothetical protein
MPVVFEIQRRRLAGVVAIPVTPFGSGGGIDGETYGRLVERLTTSGIEVVTPNGNTGEFYALDGHETRLCLELAVKRAHGASVLAGVGHDVRSAVKAARHARDTGADMIMIHQPVHPYVSRDGWVEYHRAIADAVPEIGVVLYVRNPAISGEELARLGEAAPNVIGVKYAVPDPVQFATVAREAGYERFVWIAGLRDRVHVRAGERRPADFAGHVRQAQHSRLRRRDGDLGADPAVRTDACGRWKRQQRQCGQGRALPIGLVPSGRPATEPPAHGARAGTAVRAAVVVGTFMSGRRGAAAPQRAATARRWDNPADSGESRHLSFPR